MSTAYACEIMGGDGYLDLVLLFDIQELVQTFPKVEDGQLLTLELYGNLMPEFGSAPILGADTVLIVKKGK